MNICTFKALHRRSLRWLSEAGMANEGAFFARWESECASAVAKERSSNRASYAKHAIVRREDARRQRERRKANPVAHREHKARVNLRRKQRIIDDPQYKMARRIRTRVWMAIHKGYGRKAAKTFQLLGCTAEQFTKHIERLWLPGMTWGNYGRNGWEIDHIVACVEFDLTKLSEQKKCFHYTNTQPLWAVDNRSKGARRLRQTELPLFL